ncbi:MAG TPA: pyridoxamine 5'-phosphate oxidase family protein [Actinomycetota bacterium]|nr:pyridoxamine 5'-phosphate oxidase family protein [Actinomycetota bacterium]
MGALPEQAEQVLGAALVCEFTVIGPEGRPITHPMIPLYDGERIYMTSSVLFSRKLRHVKANPRVSVAVTDPAACPGLDAFHRVTVQGDATVHEGDLHRDWERILPLWTAKEPMVASLLAKRVALPLFWERALIEVVPRRVLVWTDGRTDRPAQVYEGVTS